MAATRTQIYLSDRQRRRLDERQRREGKSMAAVIREAIDAYLTESPADLDRALDETFGSVPDLDVPARAEWARRDERFG
jgi:predicted DNA-binding protein